MLYYVILFYACRINACGEKTDKKEMMGFYRFL